MSSVIQRNLSSGEISPALHSRIDLSRYQAGLATARNIIVQRNGGVINRSGSKVVSRAKYDATSVRLVPFIYNSDQAYVLEFGNSYIRIIKNGEYLYSSSLNITGIAKGTTTTITSATHGLSNGVNIKIAGIVGSVQLNDRFFKVSNVTTNTFDLLNQDGSSVDSTSHDDYVSGGVANVVLEITSPYSGDEVDEFKYVQTADVMTIVHPSCKPRELSRESETSWVIEEISFEPSLEPPSGIAVTGVSNGDLITHKYKISSVHINTKEESLPSSAVSVSSTEGTSTAPIALVWPAVGYAESYVIYKNQSGVYGYLGTATIEGLSVQGSFSDIGQTPDTTDVAQTENKPFEDTDDYPSTVGYFQQRRWFANTNNYPHKVWASRISFFNNFNERDPIQDDDSIDFSLAGRQVNEVRHIVDIGSLILLTSGGEWVIQGDSNGVVTPSDINMRQHSYYGASNLAPLVMAGNFLFVQNRGAIVRDFGYDYQVDSYRGNDLTAFSNHLVDGYEILDWCYQQTPHSNVWMVRSDGALLCLTYIREQSIYGWTRHDFKDASVEKVVSIPEGSTDAVYIVLKRKINGTETRTIERLSDRSDDDAVVFTDSTMVYDGSNDDGVTLVLTATDWTSSGTVTATTSENFFNPSDVGNEIHIGSGSTKVRLKITGYTSQKIVTGTPVATISSAYRGTTISSFSKAVSALYNLQHLEGSKVSVLADGFVLSNPNNPNMTELTVTNGALTLSNCYSVIAVGLPITADLETLEIDTIQNGSIMGMQRLVNKVTLRVSDTRGVWVGEAAPDSDDSLDGLVELKSRSNESYNSAPNSKTGIYSIPINATWNTGGKVFVRQTDPLPMEILSIKASGYIPNVGGI